MVGGIAQAGDVDVLSALKPGDFEVISSHAGCFDKAIDVTAPSVPDGSDTLAQVSARIADGLRALGGDHPPAGGGPSSPFANTWSYLKARIPGASVLPDLTFNLGLAYYFGTPAGQVNLETMTPPPLFTVDDHWWFATLASVRDVSTGLTADPAPPYAPYASNSNQDTPVGNPFAARCFTTVGTPRTVCGTLTGVRRSITRSAKWATAHVIRHNRQAKGILEGV